MTTKSVQLASVRPRAITERMARAPPATELRSSAIHDDAPDGSQSVAPADLLSLAVAAGAVSDRHLDHSVAAPGDAGGDLGLDAETILAQPWSQGLKNFPAEDLVTGFHVGEREAGEAVRQCGQ